MIFCVLFDFDGVIADTERSNRDCLAIGDSPTGAWPPNWQDYRWWATREVQQCRIRERQIISPVLLLRSDPIPYFRGMDEPDRKWDKGSEQMEDCGKVYKQADDKKYIKKGLSGNR